MALMCQEFLKHFKYFKYFIFITTLSDRYFSITILKMRKLRPRRSSGFPKVTELVSCRIRIQSRKTASRVFALSICSTEGEKRKIQNFGRPVKIKNEEVIL